MISNYRKIVAILLVYALIAYGYSTLDVALVLETPSIGISTTPDGRQFLVYARFLDGSTGPQVAE
jgi:hypothetical protein